MSTYTEYYPLPQPEELSNREKDDGMGAYLMMFAAIGAGLPLPLLNLIASIIYYYINRNKSRFVRFHALQSLWSQLPVTLLNSTLVIWFIRILFFGERIFTSTFMGLIYAAILINIVYFIFSIYAAIQAKKGRFYYFVFFGKLAYHQVYKISDEPEKEHISPVNKPPMY